MQKKHILGALVAINVVIGAAYFFWPQTSAEGEVKIDPAAQAGRAFDRLAANVPFLNNSFLDQRTVINGHPVPPMPDPVENKKTVSGVDSDHNGIRDDIDRLVAEDFGDSSKYFGAVLYAKAMQEVMIHPTKENAEKSDNEAACVAPLNGSDETHYALLKMEKLERMLVNTRERGNAYSVFAGTGLGRCPRK